MSFVRFENTTSMQLVTSHASLSLAIISMIAQTLSSAGVGWEIKSPATNYGQSSTPLSAYAVLSHTSGAQVCIGWAFRSSSEPVAVHRDIDEYGRGSNLKMYGVNGPFIIYAPPGRAISASKNPLNADFSNGFAALGMYASLFQADYHHCAMPNTTLRPRSYGSTTRFQFLEGCHYGRDLKYSFSSYLSRFGQQLSGSIVANVVLSSDTIILSFSDTQYNGGVPFLVLIGGKILSKDGAPQNHPYDPTFGSYGVLAIGANPTPEPGSISEIVDPEKTFAGQFGSGECRARVNHGTPFCSMQGIFIQPTGIGSWTPSGLRSGSGSLNPFGSPCVSFDCNHRVLNDGYNPSSGFRAASLVQVWAQNWCTDLDVRTGGIPFIGTIQPSVCCLVNGELAGPIFGTHDHYDGRLVHIGSGCLVGWY